MLRPENLVPLSENKKIVFEGFETGFRSYSKSLEDLNKGVTHYLFKIFTEGNYYAHFTDKMRLRGFKHFAFDQIATKWES